MSRTRDVKVMTLTAVILVSIFKFYNRTEESGIHHVEIDSTDIWDYLETKAKPIPPFIPEQGVSPKDRSRLVFQDGEVQHHNQNQGKENKFPSM